MNIPDDLVYTETHEWLRRESDGVVIGITDYAQGELTDIVFVELPQVGRRLGAKEEICALESVKAVAYVYAPVAGKLAAVNEKLSKQPELINKDPYGEGWIVRIEPDSPEQSVKLLDAAAYRSHIARQAGSTPGTG
jgi:glycine cleavage system H protein